MQFITNGPDIPDALLQAHEDGRVVFFCGAGISYPAGLPGFKGLVDEIYRRNGTAPTDIERAALDREQFDATLDLLERRLPGRRLAVRRELAQALKPNLRRKGATDTHEALLQLARDRKGALRLVTTNFDRVFHAAAKRSRHAFHAHAAPMLPIPKNSRWDGLVYLHGLLPEKAGDTDLNRLVVTSGDFGLAYLTERWAARFVSELFRNYVVCFVGYSINDPVLRYMMDALAADRMLGEVTPQAWALGDCEPGQEGLKTVEWEARGVTPVLYHVGAGTHDHSALHHTLKVWAEIYRDGVMGKERIVVAHALSRPSASTRQDDFVGRMLWALSDTSGLPARTFADFNPAPSLDWLLDAFAEDRFGHADLRRFGVPPREEVDTKLQFSLIHRPSPYPLAPSMQLITQSAAYSRWDDVMFQLARWLARHLNDVRLVLWIAEHGGEVNQRLIELIEHQLHRLIDLERNGKTSELDEIRAQAPNAIPTSRMRTLWRLLHSGRVKSAWQEADLYQWKTRLDREGLTATVRLELRELLAPKVRLRKPIHWSEASDDGDEPKQVAQLVDWELVLAADHVHSGLSDLADAQWHAALPSLLDDLQQLLRDALELLRELNAADERSDRSHWNLPSVSPHWQNRGFHDWVSLIEMLRDAWLAVWKIDGVRARRTATAWFELPYPAFKRLALFAASQEGAIPSEQWVEWVLADEGWWLWAEETKREVLRLFILQGADLDPAMQERLGSAIVAGPSRSMYPDDLQPDHWQESFDHSVWLRLAKLSASGLTLNTTIAAQLAKLSRQHPEWKLKANQSDEFYYWMSGTGDPDYDEQREVDVAPRKRVELRKWLLKTSPERRPFYEDTWREVCRTRFFHSLYALCDLAREGVWPAARWREALQAWAEEGVVMRSWHFAAPLVQSMPDAEMREISHSLTWWLQSASKSVNRDDALLVPMCERVLALHLDEDTDIRRSDGAPIQRPVTEAINHPIGHVTQAIINLWFKGQPNDDEGLPVDILLFFIQLCDPHVQRFRHGRVLMSSRLIALFRVDREWTKQYLLPFFDWSSDPVEAKAAWEGFLWSPRLYQPLLLAFKSDFLKTARHYRELGEHARQFAAFLTYAALGPTDGYTAEDWRDAFAALAKEGLEESAQALAQALEGAADQREEYWRNRIWPFWRDVWPKSLELATPAVAKSLARLCVAAGSEFPGALKALISWLGPIEQPGYVIRRLSESGLCAHFPRDAVRLMAAIIRDQPWGAGEIKKCLDLVVQADSGLVQDPDYRRLLEYARRRG